MAVTSRQFYYVERKHSAEYWYKLCFDADNGRFFIQEDSSTATAGFKMRRREIETADFLRASGDPQDALVGFVAKLLA